MTVTYETLKDDEQVRSYIQAGNDALKSLGFTEHYFPPKYHVK